MLWEAHLNSETVTSLSFSVFSLSTEGFFDSEKTVVPLSSESVRRNFFFRRPNWKETENCGHRYHEIWALELIIHQNLVTSSNSSSESSFSLYSTPSLSLKPPPKPGKEKPVNNNGRKTPLADGRNEKLSLPVLLSTSVNFGALHVLQVFLRAQFTFPHLPENKTQTYEPSIITSRTSVYGVKGSPRSKPHFVQAQSSAEKSPLDFSAACLPISMPVFFTLILSSGFAKQNTFRQDY